MELHATDAGSDVTVPVRGIRLHRYVLTNLDTSNFSYCPREGYKVASQNYGLVASAVEVTVPVRGIRLHQPLQGLNPALTTLLSP